MVLYTGTGYDTLKRVENGRVDCTVDRHPLACTNTSGFGFLKYLMHMRLTQMDLTGHAAVAEMAGLNIAMVNGMEENIKITQSNDLKMRNSPFGTMFEYRVGQGFDVHKFEDDDHIQCVELK